MDDLRLLREYARTGCQPAFEQVVRRHIDLVYGVCLRHVRHAQDAEDATQAVFIHLARKAGRFREGTVLAAWLHHVARLEAAQHVRKMTVRRKHEMAAARASRQDQPTEGTSDPRIDKALSRLRAGERAAVLLRFFQGRSFPEVGRELRISEEAARKRVSRGLEKLRGILRPVEGSVLSVAAVEALLQSSVHAAPSALVGATMKAVSAKAAAAAGAAIGKGAILTMTITKTKAALVCAAALLLVTGGTVAVSHYVGRGHDEAIVMRDPAPGTAAITAVVATQPAYNGPPIVGYARLPDGTPVAGAAVFMSTPDHYLDVYDTENLREPHLMSGVVTTTIEGSTSITSKRIVGPMDIPAPVEATTGPDGRFAFQPTQVPAGLLVRGTMGMGIATAADVQSGRPVVVKPWARIEGVNRIGTQPLAGASNWSVWAINVDDVAVLNTANVRIFATATPDQSGRFVIGRLMAGPTFVQRMFSLQGGQVYLGRGGKIEFSKFPRGIWLSQVIDLAPAQTTVVKIGGTGWPITGRVKQPVSEFTFRRGVLSTNPPLDSENSYPIDFAPDGTFRVNDMPAGKYHLHGDFAVAAAGRGQAMTYRALNYVASADIDFVIPPMSGGRSDEPLDVGEIPLKPLPQLTIGKPAPDLALRMLDGSPRRLSDFRRKYVLLQIWTEGRRYLQREQLRLRAIHDRIDKDARFALLGVNVDALPRETCKKALESGVRWPQAMLADPDRALPEEYRNSGSSLYLLDPQGNVLAKDLDEITAYEAVEQVLGNRKATDAVVRVEREPGASADAQTAYRDVPAPGPDTVSASALVTIVDGAPDGNSGQPHRLIDGRMPSVPDSPSQSFFFNTGTLEGRFRLDLPQLTSIQQINTYSWHTGTRAPQVYRVYGSDGSSKSLDPAPKIGTDPTTCGWTLIASVDTRPAKGTMGGRYAASIAAPKGTLGAYRQLLFVVFPTETNDEWGNTLYGEINVIGAP